jgi:hypothetical protein
VSRESETGKNEPCFSYICVTQSLLLQPTGTGLGWVSVPQGWTADVGMDHVCSPSFTGSLPWDRNSPHFWVIIGLE